MDTALDIKLKNVMQFFVMEMLKKGYSGLPDLPESLLGFKHLRSGTVVVSHNGTLSAKQSRQWGYGESYKTAGRYRKKFNSNPTALLPCLATCYDIERESDIPFEALTLGAKDFKGGRTHALYIIEALAPNIPNHQYMINALKDAFTTINEGAHLLEKEDIPEMFHDIFEEWENIHGLIMAEGASDEERQAAGNFGTW